MQTDREHHRIAGEDRIAVTLLLVLVLTAFANVVFGGRSLIPSENINPLDYRLAAPDFIPAEVWQRRDLVPYPNFRDVAASTMQFEPSREFLRRSLLRGEFPFWDPYIGGGAPSFAALAPAYLFPPSLLVVLLGNGSLVNNIYILTLILCSGTLTYFFLRRHGLSWQAALAGGIAFSFSGAVIQTTPSAMGQPVAFFALPLIVTARLIDAPGARRAAQLALAFAFVALATFPPILMQSFGMSVVYLVVALVMTSRSRKATAFWFAAGAAISLAIVAVAYVPAVTFMAEIPHVARYYSHAAADIMQPEQIRQLLSPTIAGGAPVYIHPASEGPTSLHLYYTGVLALFLSGIGFLARAERKAQILKITATLCGVLALAKIFGMPPVHWIADLPLLRNIHYGAYFGILVAFCVAVLASLGVEALVERRVQRWQIAASGFLLALALSVLRAQAWREGVEFHPQGWRWIADYRLLVLFSALGLVFAWMASRPSRGAPAALLLVLAVLAIEGITNSAFPRPRRWNTWTHPPKYIERLNELNTGGRVLPMPVYPANTESVFRHPTIDTILFSSSRMFGLYKRHFSRGASHFLRDTVRIPPERVLDAANIEYLAIITSNGRRLSEARERGYTPVYSDSLVQLLRRRTDPRYSFTSTYLVARSKRESLDRLETLPAGTVLLEQPPSFASVSASGAGVRPRVSKFSLNEVELVVEAPRAGLLVCSESNMSGWTATVDGRPTPILAANYAFRAVEVPAGRHTIRFAYVPPGLIPGLVATLIGLIACGWGLLQPRPEPSPEC